MLLCVVFQWEEVSLGAFLQDRPRIIFISQKKGKNQNKTNISKQL